MNKVGILYDSRFYFYCVKYCYYYVLQYEYHIKHSELYLYSDLDISLRIHKNDYSGYIINMNYTPFIKSHIHQAKDYVNYNTDLAIKQIKRRLQQGMPCITAVNGFALRYHPFYQKKNEKHSVIVHTIDRTDDTVMLTDNFPPYFFQGKIPLTDYKKAYAGEWSYLSKDNWEANPEVLIFETLLQVYNSFFIIKNKDQFYGRYALNFLKTLGEVFEIQQITDSRVFEHYHTQLVKYVSKLKYFQFYIEKSLQYAPAFYLNNIKVNIDSLLKIWNLISIYLIKNIYSGKTNYQFVELIKEVYRQMTRLEESIKKAIKCIQ